nr:GNAT family N-acetyltransferase [bacterium]
MPSNMRAAPATPDDAGFISGIYKKNMQALYGSSITLPKWRKLLSAKDPDEQNFIILRDEVPVAWMRLNGLLNLDVAWIAMLVVSPDAQRMGVGTFAVDFAQKFAWSRGFQKLRMHTTQDNLPARGLYRSCGFDIIEYGHCTTADGVLRRRVTFEKWIG